MLPSSPREAKGPGQLLRQEEEDKDKQTSSLAVPVMPGLDPGL